MAGGKSSRGKKTLTKRIHSRQFRTTAPHICAHACASCACPVLQNQSSCTTPCSTCMPGTARILLVSSSVQPVTRLLHEAVMLQDRCSHHRQAIKHACAGLKGSQQSTVQWCVPPARADLLFLSLSSSDSANFSSTTVC